MSYTAMRFEAVRAASLDDERSRESFDTRLRALAVYLIGRFA